MAILEKSLATGATVFILYYVLMYNPCIVKSYNRAEAVFTLLELIPILFSLLMLIIKNSLIPFILMIGSTLLVVGISIVYILRKTKKYRIASKKIKEERERKKRRMKMEQEREERKPLKKAIRDEEEEKKEDEVVENEKEKRDQKKSTEKLLGALFSVK